MKEIKIENYLDDGEEVVWQGRAKENDYLSSSLINMLPFVFIWLTLELIILSYTGISKAMLGKEFNTYYLIFTIAAILLHLIPVGIWVVNVVRINAALSNAEYAVTDRRILISRSSSHESVEYIDFAQVDEMRLRRSLGEFILSTGRIVIETDGGDIVLNSVGGADKIFKKIYRTVMAEKIDG